MISEYLRSIVRCPACLGSDDVATREGAQATRLSWNGSELICQHCGGPYQALGEPAYLDLRPPADTFNELTEYAEEEFHYRKGSLRPLFLSARVKMGMMQKMLAPSIDEAVLDIGCGNGRFVFFTRSSCGELVGIDAGANFVTESLETVDLTRGDIRRLPFANESFEKAFSLDVLEHLTEDGVVAMLSEARRVLKSGGRLFLYSHVMMSSRLAFFQRGVNQLIRYLDRYGLVDNEPERERKSDHENAIRSYEQLESILEEMGFCIVDIRYYNVFLKALIEDLMLPLVEHNFFSKTKKKRLSSDTVESRENQYGSEVEHHRWTKPDIGRWTHAPLHVASYLMKLDVALFGRVRTGPFFLLLKKI